MIAQKVFFRALLIPTLLVMTLTSTTLYAVDNKKFSATFSEYNEVIGDFTEELPNTFKSDDWSKATQLGKKLKELSQRFVSLAKKEGKPVWRAYAENMDNHTDEMAEALAAKEAAEVIFLTGVLRDHIGYIQSTNAQWLRVYYPQQMKLLKKALEAKDAKAAAEHAEVLHLGGNKIATSAGMQKELYKHTRWLKDIIEVSRLGDAIIGAVTDGKFKDTKTPYKKMERAFVKWDRSFR